MSSLGKQKLKTGAYYFVQLSPGEHANRAKIRLGRIKKSDAQSAKMHIDNLLNSRGYTVSLATQEWLAEAPDVLRDRLEHLGIIPPRNHDKMTVSEWVHKYIGGRKSAVKESTRRKWEDVESKLKAFFQNDLLNSVNPHRAMQFRDYLSTKAGLSENSVRRQIGIARQFFNAAIEAQIINQNPFTGSRQPVSVRANPSKFFYVTAEIAQKVLDACPDAEWRLIFGLARFGGLRCPSEILRLRWQDVDFGNNRFIVHSSKTERHGDSGIRSVPMFPELKPLFQDAFDQAQTGTVYCITRYRDKGVNLRTQLERIIKRAGLDPWKKLFQNCRSTRETELFKLTGGNVRAVCTWIGNSPQVAMLHYAQLTEADMKDAAEMAVMESAQKTLKEADQKADQIPDQSGIAINRTEPHKQSLRVSVSPYSSGGKRHDAARCEIRRKTSKWAIQDSNL